VLNVKVFLLQIYEGEEYNLGQVLLAHTQDPSSLEAEIRKVNLAKSNCLKTPNTKKGCQSGSSGRALPRPKFKPQY
jgi:hypothetical protein